MFDSNDLIMPVSGFIIISLLGIISFFIRKWIKSSAIVIDKIFDVLENIKGQIYEIKTDNQLLSAAIREIETRIEFRLQGIERSGESRSKKIDTMNGKLTAVEKDVEKIKTYHKQNHPDNYI